MRKGGGWVILRRLKKGSISTPHRQGGCQPRAADTGDAADLEHMEESKAAGGGGAEKGVGEAPGQKALKVDKRVGIDAAVQLEAHTTGREGNRGFRRVGTNIESDVRGARGGGGRRSRRRR